MYRYTLEGPAPIPWRFGTLQDWIVRPGILRAPGVADVVSYGGLVREVHDGARSSRMASLGVGLNDVFQALSKASSNASGGYVERGSEMFVIRSLGISPICGISKRRVWRPTTACRCASATSLHVSEGYAPRQGVVTGGENEEAVEGIVLMRRGENPSVVLEGLRIRMAEIERILPNKVKISPFYDRTELVHTTLHTVYHNLLEGALLVVLVLFAFTLSWRASLIVATVIPLSLAASFAYLRARGMSANLLSMGAIDFGIIVDGAVILVEHLFHEVPQRRSDSPESLMENIAQAMHEVASSHSVFAIDHHRRLHPDFLDAARRGADLLTDGQHGGQRARGGAGRELTLIRCWPSSACAGQGSSASPHSLAGLARPTFRRSISGCAARYRCSSWPSAPCWRRDCSSRGWAREFLPELNEGALYVTFTLPSNMSLAEAQKLTPRLKKLILRTPEAKAVLTQLGRPEDGTDPSLPNNLEAFVKLAPPEEWREVSRY